VPRAPNRAEVEARIVEPQKAIDQQAHAKEGQPDSTTAPGKAQPETVTPNAGNKAESSTGRRRRRADQ
jgi:hypothetical protein